MPRVAGAGLTTVNPPAPGEVDLPTILGNAYGGTFTPDPSATQNYTNGTITAVRIDDGTPGVTPSGTTDGTNTLMPIGGNDELWQGSVLGATALGVFAADDQELGYLPDSSGGSFTQIFAAGGYGFGVTGSATAPVGGSLVSSDSGIFRFARDGNQGMLASSSDVDNSDGQDHMVTYEIEGLGNGLNTFVLAFEDTSKQCGGDFDFNDLVVQVDGPGSLVNGVSAPEPAGLVAVGIGLLVAGRRRRAI